VLLKASDDDIDLFEAILRLKVDLGGIFF